MKLFPEFTCTTCGGQFGHLADPVYLPKDDPVEVALGIGYHQYVKCSVVTCTDCGFIALFLPKDLQTSESES